MADYKIPMEVSRLEVLNKQLLWRLRERQRGEGSEAIQKPVKREWTQQKHLKNINKNEEFVMGPCSEDHLLMISLPKSSVTSLHVYLCNTSKAMNERFPGQSVASLPVMYWNFLQ
jgi:hypothetical protein